MAFSRLRVAQKLIALSEIPIAASNLYFAAFHASQAACLELCGHSKRHRYWIRQLNRHFGMGQGWLPKRYVRLTYALSDARTAADYSGTMPSDPDLINQWEYSTDKFLKKVRSNTPLVLYPEFISNFLLNHFFELDAVEFDFYCPKSYIHKERVQFQVMIEKFNETYLNRLVISGRIATRKLSATRQEDYVLGWNNRLGQAGDAYLLFLDLDDDDEGKVKAALKGRRGWLFKSGNGFHFIGRDLLPSRKFWQMRLLKAAKSKALKSILDQRYVDFSFRKGYSTLRIGTSECKEFMPFLCWDNSK